MPYRMSFSHRGRLFGVGIDEDEFISLLILTKLPPNDWTRTRVDVLFALTTCIAAPACPEGAIGVLFDTVSLAPGVVVLTPKFSVFVLLI